MKQFSLLGPTSCLAGAATVGSKEVSVYLPIVVIPPGFAENPHFGNGIERNLKNVTNVLGVSRARSNKNLSRDFTTELDDSEQGAPRTAPFIPYRPTRTPPTRTRGTIGPIRNLRVRSGRSP